MIDLIKRSMRQTMLQYNKIQNVDALFTKGVASIFGWGSAIWSEATDSAT